MPLSMTENTLKHGASEPKTKPLGRINYDSMQEEVKMDLKDKRILMMLEEDSRMPLTQLAKAVQLSRDAVDYRIRRMQEAGLIIRFFANLNFEKLGYYIFHVFILMDEMNSKDQPLFIDHLMHHPNVVSVLEYSDRWDLEVVLIAKSLQEFDQIILSMTEQFSHVVLEKDKAEIIRKYNADFLPPLLETKQKVMEEVSKKDVQLPKLDKVDYKILHLLADDARRSTYDIAREAGISSDTVSYRIKRLVQEGVIRNFSILVNLSLLKFQWYTYTVEMKYFDHSNEKKFEEFLRQHPHILRAVKTLGGWDLLLYIAVEHPTIYHQIIKDIKRTFSNIIKHYDAWIAYKEHIYTPMPKVIGSEGK